MDKIKLIKLNKDYQSDPNIANPKVKTDQKDLSLSFKLNYFIFPFKEGQLGEIVFHNCHSYRLGMPNDEGFYLKEDEFWNKENFPNIEWNCFYEVEGVPSSSTENFQIVNGNAANSTTRLNHYVFFIKEATFECLAESYSENISYKI